VIAGGDIQVERLPIPSVVYAQLMPAGSYRNRDGAAVHELGDSLTVELHDDLAELDILRRVSTNGNLRLSRYRRGRGHGGGQRTAKNGRATVTS
jgi:hypothetical protein